uniref:PlsC domain-containing protein n=1 Tax=Heterorhabditis bacteriophora TaxID=37862 RepID=A0A1I7XI58_HETBA
MDRNRYSFGLTGLGIHSSHTFLVAPYKRIPLYPLISPSVDLFHSNHKQLQSPCSTCFPQTMPDHQDNYIDMLEIPSFGGPPWPLAPGVQPPSRWFADFRYTISTSIPHCYPSVHKEVMESRRWLLRATGAFFIRRRLDPFDEGGKDALYRAVLHSYIEQMLKKGLSIEFFLEGTRSRFGKPLIPKHGLISNVVEAVQQGIISDCYLVPVSYTYDQVAEGVFLNELMGIPKMRESVLGVLRGVLKGFGIPQRCGAVRIHYGKPVLLTDYLNLMSENLTLLHSVPSQLSRIPHSYSYRELIPWHSEHKERVDNRTLIRAIGYHIVCEAQSMASISLVSVISTLFLCKFRNVIDINL